VGFLEEGLRLSDVRRRPKAMKQIAENACGLNAMVERITASVQKEG